MENFSTAKESIDDEPEEFDLMKVFLISEKGWFRAIWKPIELISCLASSYYYSWYMAFIVEDVTFEIPAVVFESIFLISLINNFLKEYTPDGET